MQFIAEYGMFLLKTATLVIAILITLAAVLAISVKGKIRERLTIKKLNEKYADYRKLLRAAILPKSEQKKLAKAEKKTKKAAEKTASSKPRIFVINFIGDIKASGVKALREEITSILQIATPSDEVVVCVESPGGIVHAYGLAASQLARIRQKNIPLTVCVDKVAASGGYLMACVANKILAAPFSIIGSIGVIAQLPNFHRFLKKKDIDFEQITAGEYKRTLTVFGENTEKGREKLKEEVEEIQQQFKQFITHYRPQVDISKVATGEHWLAHHALSLQLVDELTTSDDYLWQASQTHDIYEISYRVRKGLLEKFSSGASQAFYKITGRFTANDSNHLIA